MGDCGGFSPGTAAGFGQPTLAEGNQKHSTFNVQATDAEKLGGSALNVECSMFR
jgi:hypothetical protein